MVSKNFKSKRSRKRISSRSRFGGMGVGPMGNNLMGVPPTYPNMKAFPHLGAYNGEVGPGTSPGGIGMGSSGTWPMSLPLAYWWNFGSRTSKKSGSKKRKFSRSKRVSRKRKFHGSKCTCKKPCSCKKICKNTHCSCLKKCSKGTRCSKTRYPRRFSKKRSPKRRSKSKTRRSKSKTRRSKSRTRRSKSRTRRKSRSPKRKSKKRPSKRKKPSVCKQRVSEQIRKNMRLFKEGKEFSSSGQAIAVAYSQVSKKHPHCRRFLQKS